MIFKYAVETASEQAAFITHFRNFYTVELSPRAVEAGMSLSHSYKNSPNSLPLPATMTIELGKYLSGAEKNTQVALYSDYPFPWRESERKLDSFQQDAIRSLRERPDQPYVREEMMNGQRVLRYAQADRMLEKCVACHNAYPNSPKKDWKVGDVRGVLEIISPVTHWDNQNTALLNQTFTILLSLCLIGLGSTWLFVRQLRVVLSVKEKLSDERQTAIEALESEIQERTAVEAQLKISQSKLASIFESVPEAILVSDVKGVIVQCNPASEYMFEYQKHELIGRKLNILMNADDESRHDRYLENFMHTGEEKLINKPRVLDGKTKSGRIFPVRITISQTKVESERFFIGVLQDFTSIQNTQDLLIEAKEKAEKANKLRGEFLANMSHEIRTPMNGILGMTSLALETEDRFKQKEYLGLAQESARYLLHVINEILDFSKIESGTMELYPVAVDIVDEIRKTCCPLALLAKNKNVEFKMDFSDSIPSLIQLDPLRFKQILNNLVGNAVKFTEKGWIFISVDIERYENGASALKIGVRDSGIGFDKKAREQLFQPFVQADGSVTRSFGGTGLGLAITFKLIQLMKGRIAADASPGFGAYFEVIIPFECVESNKISNLAVAEEQNSMPVSTMNVLIVDDNQINLKLAGILIQKMGFQYETAENGKLALEKLRRKKYDLVLMDVMMPVMDGETAVKELRSLEEKQGGHIPVLIVTANAMSGDREKYMAWGADGYVAKPILPDVLRHEIGKIFAGKKS